MKPPFLIKQGKEKNMFVINGDKSIYITRGDIGVIEVGAVNGETDHTFSQGDIVRLQVLEKKQCNCVVLQKEVMAEDGAQTVDISLTKEDTRIGEIINKPVDYWYEIELNPDTAPQTIIGYDDDGPKIFRLFPEGVDAK